jgi:hypothetical protein
MKKMLASLSFYNRNVSRLFYNCLELFERIKTKQKLRLESVFFYFLLLCNYMRLEFKCNDKNNNKISSSLLRYTEQII